LGAAETELFRLLHARYPCISPTGIELKDIIPCVRTFLRQLHAPT